MADAPMDLTRTEELLMRLGAVAELQNSNFIHEQAQAQNRHAEVMGYRKDDDRKDTAADNFAQQQQGQEVQLSKKSQYFTDKLLQLQKKETGSATKGSSESAEETAENTAKMKDGVIDQLKDGIKSRWEMGQQQLASFGSLSNLAGGIKTDASLILGNTAALTSLPGVQTLLQTTYFLLANATRAIILGINAIVKPITTSISWLGENVMSPGFKIVSAWLAKGYWGDFKERLKKKKDEMKENTGGWMRGMTDKWGEKTGLLERQWESGPKGMQKVLRPSKRGAMLAGIFKPFMALFNLLNPFKKVILIATVVIGALFALFKDVFTGEKSFFQLMGEWFQKIKDFYNDFLKEKLEYIWEGLMKIVKIFMEDIVPFVAKILEVVLPPLFEVFMFLADIMWKITTTIFGIVGWIYDNILGPVVRWFTGAEGVEEMPQLDNPPPTNLNENTSGLAIDTGTANLNAMNRTSLNPSDKQTTGLAINHNSSTTVSKSYAPQPTSTSDIQTMRLQGVVP